MEHPESDYIQRVLGEPLIDALSAVLLYKPRDPIYFLASYLRYWADKVRNYRRKKAAVVEMERILSVEVPWNIKVQAAKAIQIEQDYLKGERIHVEELERRRLAELKRVRELTEERSTKATDRMRYETSLLVLVEITEMGADLAFHVWEKAEKARRKVEKASLRASNTTGEEDEEEEEEEEDDD